MYDTDTLMKVNTWRQKAQAGQLSQEETREIIQHLRAGRVQAVTAQKTSKAKSAPMSGEDADKLIAGL